MKNKDRITPVRTCVYYAICELCDAQSNLHDILCQLDDDHVRNIVADIYDDIDRFIGKLHDIAL